MERADLFLKGAVAFAGAFVSWLVGGLGLAFTVLLALMALDFITGIMAGAFSEEGLNSSKGYKGFVKKLYVILLIGSVYLIELIGLNSAGAIGDGIAIAYCVIEFLSIIENGGKLGVPLGPVEKIITAFKKEGPRNG